MKVVLYTRYSSDNQSETSIEQQIKVCREYCEKHNYTVVAEYKDEAISGRTDLRPQFQKMIKDSKRNLFKAVVIYSVDRFGRTVHQSARYANELEESGVSLQSATEHISDGPSGRLTLNMMMAFAQYYSDELGQKIIRGQDYNAEHGYITSGGLALGYKAEIVDASKSKPKKKYVVDEKAAPIVKRIFEMYADEAKTMTQICEHFNEIGIKTSRNVPFNKNSLRKLLQNKKYIGTNVYRNVEYPDTVPRIIDDDLFERAQQALEKNKKAPAKNKAVGDDEYLLTLKLFCGHCRELMTGWSGTGKLGKLHRYYRCGGRRANVCDKKNVRRDYIENTVIKQCREALTDEKIEEIANEVVAFNAEEQRNNINLKRLEKLVSDNKKQRNNLMDTLKLCEDEDTKRMILSELSEMGKEAKALEIQLAQEESRKVIITRREIMFFLKDLQNGDISNIKYRKALVTAFISRIYLYDDGRLTIFFNNGDTTTEVEANLIDKLERAVLDRSGTRGYFIGDLVP